MVYEKKCSECGKIIDFGGKDPEQEDGKGLPDNAMRFGGELYCRECVKGFVDFGTGKLIDRIQDLEEEVDELRDELGVKK